MNRTLIILFMLLPFTAAAQTAIDSLRHVYLSARNDSILYEAASHLYDRYEELSRDSALFYADICVKVSRKNNKKINEAYFLSRKAYQELNIGRYAKSLHSLLEGFVIAEDPGIDAPTATWSVEPLTLGVNNRLYALNCNHHIYGILMKETGNRQQELFHFREAKRIAVDINSPARSLLAGLNLGRIYFLQGDLDSALQAQNEAEQTALNSGRRKYLSSILYYQGMIFLARKDTASALSLFHRSVELGREQNNIDGIAKSLNALANYFISKGNRDSSLYYAVNGLESTRKIGTLTGGEHIGFSYDILYRAYHLRNQTDSAYHYLALAKLATDSINRERITNLSAFQQLTLEEQHRLQNAEKETVAYRNTVRTYLLLAGIFVLLMLAIIFYRNNRQKQKAKDEIEKAYKELKDTQKQLIHAEKMASLGEVTAGIAHEIQNPLNFVNNFSEVNIELSEDVETGIKTGNHSEALETLQSLKQNLHKVEHHGKRADAIVKSMLQHSRNSNEQKELTDINQLVEEYLRLSYHGFRAQNNSFHAIIETHFDQGVGKVNVVGQGIGRVLLNLLNNAFYAAKSAQLHKGGDFQPTVSVITERKGRDVVISVKDNGVGISEHVRDKIFQPFFTTKPTGEGTGLGLSLSYDIITKGHNGEMKLETKEGEGSKFILVIPDNKNGVKTL